LTLDTCLLRDRGRLLEGAEILLDAAVADKEEGEVLFFDGFVLKHFSADHSLGDAL